MTTVARVSNSVIAIRGATTVDADTAAQVGERVQTLVEEILTRNKLVAQDLISVIFTATEDITSMFPATAARLAGLGDVPLLCAKELSVVDATPLCIRVLMHINFDRDKSEVHHVYLEKAAKLRDDLPE